MLISGTFATTVSSSYLRDEYRFFGENFRKLSISQPYSLKYISIYRKNISQYIANLLQLSALFGGLGRPVDMLEHPAA